VFPTSNQQVDDRCDSINKNIEADTGALFFALTIDPREFIQDLRIDSWTSRILDVSFDDEK
jgi:hypothetical protein